MNGNNTSGMDISTGTFVAEHGGPYIFTVTGLSQYSSRSAFEILHNGNRVAYAYDNTGDGNDEHTMMSQTVILDLLPLDKVYVRLLDNGMSSDSNKYIHFVGHSL